MGAAPGGWFHVVKLDAHTYAISEPEYWQQNVSYLLIGTRRALLFDTGPGIYSIRKIVRSLTSLPILVIPSHLHFDHVGRIAEFDQIALPDQAELRAEVKDRTFIETPDQYMLDRAYSFHVTHWIKDGEVFELGGRRIQVVNTPGHTPDSLALIDASHQRIFIGDLVNRAIILLNAPGSNVRDALTSVRRLLRIVPLGTVAYEAHSEQPITIDELTAVAVGLAAVLRGDGVPKPVCLNGIPARRYDIGSFPVIVPESGDLRLRPVHSATDSVDLMDSKPCSRG